MDRHKARTTADIFVAEMTADLREFVHPYALGYCVAELVDGRPATEARQILIKAAAERRRAVLEAAPAPAWDGGPMSPFRPPWR